MSVVLFSPAAHAADREVSVVDTAYQPDAIKIEAGDSVVWQWATTNASPHTVTAVNGSFDSKGGPGHTFTKSFPQPGIYAYRCKVHPVIMLGRVEVTEASPEQPQPAEPDSPPKSGDPPPKTDSSRPVPQPPPRQGPVGPPPPKPGVAAVPGMTYSRAPLAAPAPLGIAPAVAPPRDPLTVLPDARPPEAEGPPEAPAEPPVQLAVEVPPTQPGPRTGLVVGIAVATLLATAGIFSKVVLFGRPWS